MKYFLYFFILYSSFTFSQNDSIVTMKLIDFLNQKFKEQPILKKTIIGKLQEFKKKTSSKYTMKYCDSIILSIEEFKSKKIFESEEKDCLVKFEKDIVSDYDKFTESTNISSKKALKKQDRLILYFYSLGNSFQPILDLTLHDSKWLFIDSITLLSGDVKYHFSLKEIKKSVVNYNYIIESGKIYPEIEDLLILKKIFESDKVEMRYNGSQGIKDILLNKSEIYNIRKMLDFFICLNP